MSLTVYGPLVIQLVSAAQQPQVDTFGALKRCAAQRIGGENQPVILEKAGNGILRGIDDANMRHKVRFGSEVASAQALVSGTDTYSLDANFFAVQEVQLLDSDSKPAVTLEYVPWGQFNVLEQAQDETGTPMYWTARNSFDSETIQVYPIPDAKAASDFTLRVTYYTRIERPVADSDIIDAPRELGEVLCTYAEWYLLDSRHGSRRQEVRDKYAEYRDKLKEFIQSTNEEPTANLGWAIQWADDDDPNRANRALDPFWR